MGKAVRHSVDTQISGGGGGFPERWRGIISEASVLPWNYNGKAKRLNTFIRLKFDLDQDGSNDHLTEKQVEMLENGLYYNYGFISSFVPALDADCEELVDLSPLFTDETDEHGRPMADPDALLTTDPTYFDDYAGHYVSMTDEFVQMWETKGLKGEPAPFSDSDWNFFLNQLGKAEFPRELESEDGDVRFVVGLHADFERIEKPLSGRAQKQLAESGQQRKGDNKVPVVVAILDLPGAKKAKKGTGAVAAKPAAKPAAKAAPAAASAKKGAATTKAGAAASNGNAALTKKVEAAIVKALKKRAVEMIEAEEDGEAAIAREDLYQVAVKAVDSADRKDALEIVKGDALYANSEVLVFNKKTGEVSLVEE